MKVYRNLLVVFAVLFVFSSIGRAQTPNAHRHPPGLDSMLGEIAPGVSFAATTLEKDAAIENAVKNKNRTFEAFTVSLTRIFVKNLKTGKIFEIKGLPFEQRYFSDLAWATNRTLLFDRWPQPKFGNHFAVDVVKQKLTAAAPFPDKAF